MDQNRANLGLSALIGALILLVPMAVNGGPFLYFDTAGYLSRAGKFMTEVLGQLWLSDEVNPVVEPAPLVGESAADASSDEGASAPIVSGRSIYFGIPAWLAYKLVGLWSIAAIQALIAAMLIHRLMYHTLGAVSLPGFAIATILVSLVSTAGVFVGLIMPDIWIGFAAIAVALLIHKWPETGLGERILLLCVVLAATTFLKSHVLIVLGAVSASAVVYGLRLLGASTLSRTGAVSCLVVAALSLSAFAGFNWAIGKATGEKSISRPFLSGHLIAAGPGLAFLDDVCASRGETITYELCRYRDRLPIEWRAFLFDTGADTGVFAIAPPVSQRAISAQDTSFAIDVFLYDPLSVTWIIVRDSIAQVGLFRFQQVPLSEKAANYIERSFPSDIVDDVKHSRVFQEHSELRFLDSASYMSASVSIWVLLLSLGYVYFGGALVGKEWAIVATLLAFVLVNAAVCGGIASPYDRFQSRIVWLVPLAAFLAAALALRSRRAGQTELELSKKVGFL